MSNGKNGKQRRSTLEQLLEAYTAITGNPCTQFTGEMKGDAWFVTLQGDYTNDDGEPTPSAAAKELLKSMVGRVIEQAENARKQAREVEDRLRAMGHTKSRKSRKAAA